MWKKIPVLGIKSTAQSESGALYKVKVPLKQESEADGDERLSIPLVDAG